MSSQERTILTSLISALICFSIYLYYMNGLYVAGDFNGAEAGALLGKSVFYLVGLSIIVTIITTILVSIGNAIITGEKNKDLADERDGLISQRGIKVSFLTFSAGFLFIMAGLAWANLSLILGVFLIICVMFLCAVTGDAAKLYHYRRGL